ncbi:hypothetical protein VQL36_02560 [Chengkuizengella sp. SCS-71B]|uniref:hypothetical protein n=1 Tax=Chengkuizengella sp. SCS-71B TaxID=3115290 RepID=UPI0032C2349C
MSGHNGSTAGIVLVLFILLVIILIAASGRSRYTSYQQGAPFFECVSRPSTV